MSVTCFRSRVSDHNRVHATDVLQGVYYMTTQPIPGFTQAQPGDGFAKNLSSSDSGKKGQGVGEWGRARWPKV